MWCQLVACKQGTNWHFISFLSARIQLLANISIETMNPNPVNGLKWEAKRFKAYSGG